MVHTVMVYIYDKSINSNLLPSFNSGYINSCVIKDTDLGNNLIQREITNEEALPTSITMSNQPSLIEILECNATNCTHLYQSFYSNINLKRCKIQVGSKVNSLSHTLYSCSKLEYLDLSDSDFSSCTDTMNVLNLNAIKTLNLENVKFTNSTVNLVRSCSSLLSEINLNNVDTSLVTDMSAMFSGKINLTELNLSSFDTSSVTNMDSMFNGTLLDCLDLSNFNISNVSNFNYMLKNCQNLKVFKLSQSKFPSNETEVTMREMFCKCTSIEVLDLSNITFKKIKTIEQAFYNMSSLKELNICNFKTNSDVSMSHVFFQTNNIEILDVSNIDLSKTTIWTNAFNNCAKLKYIGVMYCNVKTINNIAKNLRSTATFYLNEKVEGLSVVNNSVVIQPFKSNILSTPQDLELRGIGDVQDTLDLMTGELISRLGYTEHLLQDLFNFSNMFNREIQYEESSDRWFGRHAGINQSYFRNMLPLNFSITNDVNVNVSIFPVNSDWFAFYVKSSELVSKGYEATAAGLLEYTKNEKMICTYKLPNKVIKTIPINGEPLGFKDGHIMLSSGAEGYSLIPTLQYSVPVSKAAQIAQNSSVAVKHSKQIYSLEMLLMTSSIEDAYQRLLLQNDVELTRSMSDNLEPNPLRYVMLSKIIEEKSYDELDMLDKLDVFLLYNEITLEQYIELTDLILVVDTEVLE